MFSKLLGTNFVICASFKMSSANSFNLYQSKILSFGKELRQYFISSLQMLSICSRTKLCGLVNFKAIE